MTLGQKRALVAKHQKRHPVGLLCELLTLSPSGYSYRPVEAVEDGVRAEVTRVAAEQPRPGYRMIRAVPKRRGLTANAKRVRRRMPEGNLVIQVRRFVATSEYSPDHRDRPNLLRRREISRLNDARAADITYVHLGREFVYLAVVIDVFGRGIRGWHLGRDLSSELTHRAPDLALTRPGPPRVRHSDHGVQYLCQSYGEKLESRGIAVGTSAKGKPMQNGICERFIRTFKEDSLAMSEYRDPADARRQIRRFLGEVYMRKRWHSSLGYRPAAEVEAACAKPSGQKRGRR